MSATAPAAPDSLAALIAALRRLPGVGLKSAQRMAYHLLQHERGGARQLARALDQALDGMGHCHSCHNFAEHQDGEDASAVLCPICRDSTRDRSRLCILESPADLAAMERTGAYDGLYYVLMGRLSPLDGIGAQELNLAALLARAADGVVQEVILATSFTAEGEATAHAIGRALRQRGIPTSRLARGVPLGSELEYVDLATIAHALAGRHA